jgi:alkanesulfonate monooxygenase SsuD/methylene tetrahydromethanopterin reductase-like flavin-dependent oxidoreductase (luciferase family)
MDIAWNGYFIERMTLSSGSLDLIESTISLKPKEEIMKAGVAILNTYRGAQALTAIGIRDVMQGRVTPRSLFDADLGQHSLQAALRLAREADELGLDFVSVSEHHFMPLITSPNAALLAAALTQVVKRASIAWLGPNVSINNPVRIAEEIAMLDQLTGGGRVMVYLLKGTPNEHRYYGYSSEEARHRSQEASLLIKKALTEPGQFSWDGDYFHFSVISVWPGATTKPHPLLYTSGSQPETIAFAARNQFGIAVFGSPESVKDLVKHYTSQCEEAGWTPGSEHVLVRGVCVIGESNEHAEELRARMLPHPEQAIHAGAVGSTSPYDPHQQAAPKAVVPPFPVLLCGDVATATEQARELAKAGIGVLDLLPNFGGLSIDEELAIVRRIGNNLLPTLHTFTPFGA